MDQDNGEQTVDSLDDELTALIEGSEETTEEAGAAAEPEAPAAEVEEVLEALQPPDRWDSRFKDAFNSIGQEGFNARDAQQAWLDYHTERQAYHTQLEQQRAQYAQALHEYEQVTAPMSQTWQMAGLSPAQGVRQLLGWAQGLQQDPQQTILRLAQVSGVDLASHYQQQKEAEEWQDPMVRQLTENLVQLSDQFKTFQQETVREKHSAQRTAIDQHLDAFRSAVDEHGDLLYPHANTLDQRMASLYTEALTQVQQGTRQALPSLEDLYQEASWSHPEIRAELMKKQAEKDAARNTAAAANAGEASKSVKSKGAGKDVAPQQSIDDEIRGYIEAQQG